MSLTRRALSGVHPWVAARVDYILDYADHWGPNYSITSGVRTAQEQYLLFTSPNSTAVQPGCSQHQYGLAVDVWFQDPAWQQWYLSSARNVGLTTVPGDPVHAQGVPGAFFREQVQAAGLCPDPRYPGFYFIDAENFIDFSFEQGHFAGSRFGSGAEIAFPPTYE